MIEYEFELSQQDQTFEFEFEDEPVYDFTLSEEVIIGATNKYEGSYEITPTEETQIMPTDNLVMSSNVVINPIPTNYAKMTWNGNIVTFS